MHKLEFQRSFCSPRAILAIKSKSDLEYKLNNLRHTKRSELDEALSFLEREPQTKKTWHQKAFILLAYGHLEGFIKEASDLFISYITFSKHPTQELSLPIIIKIIGKEIEMASASEKIRHRVEKYNSITNQLSKRASINWKTFINTESNLNWDVFSDICFTFSIDPTVFNTKQLFFETTLLRLRNAIAHRGTQDPDSTIDMDTTLSYLQSCKDIIEKYHDELINCLQKEKFKKKNTKITNKKST